MATRSARLRAVLDTNVVYAGLFSRNPRSPTAEILQRWYNDEFDLLYCEELRLEYREKLAAEGITPIRRVEFLHYLGQLGKRVGLSPADIVGRVPADPDDDVVVACAIAGRATHPVTYDPHIHALGEAYQGVRILDSLHFLYAVRGDAPSYG
ncbi:MAG: PIN domain-containing protein [Chloroflexi bacterium]|nr:PIN domain-containing protein [Chloroflexota bacterium]